MDVCACVRPGVRACCAMRAVWLLVVVVVVGSAHAHTSMAKEKSSPIAYAYAASAAVFGLCSYVASSRCLFVAA